jgi:hypothetical protein
MCCSLDILIRLFYIEFLDAFMYHYLHGCLGYGPNALGLEYDHELTDYYGGPKQMKLAKVSLICGTVE